ncbi:hypothetical protein [uncultured Polaribacter sp.]|uniref:hypothetical protein n=1 Tax=uncultured Polaribacter sp. TaxID=174711 RepID=UPI00262F167A|nr:hypothetical protein [uncultured Polaribacter sp.]
MNKQLLFLVILLISFKSNAQDYRKYWKDGNLVWSDFQAKPTKKHTSYLAYVLLYQSDKKIIDNVTYEGVFTDAYIDKSLSFVHNNLKDEHHLKYNQVIFNLLEIYKRKLQKRIISLENIHSISSVLSDTKNQLQRKILDFQEEGNYGIDKDITAKWLSQTNLDLLKIDVFELPDFKKSNWTYGLNGGVDFAFYNDKYKEIFNNTAALTFGFEFSYKKLFMGLNMSITNSKLNENIVHNSFLNSKGNRSTISNLNITLGYPIYETNKFRILPFAGYGILSLGEVNKEKNKDEITNGSSFIGLNFDFKNRKRVNFTPSLFNIREEGNSYIRAKIFMSKSNFNPNLKGYSINIGIAYGIEGRLLSLK